MIPSFNGPTTERVGLACGVISMWSADAGARCSEIHCNQLYLSERLGQAWRKSDQSDVGKVERDLSGAVLAMTINKATFEIAHMQMVLKRASLLSLQHSQLTDIMSSRGHDEDLHLRSTSMAKSNN